MMVLPSWISPLAIPAKFFGLKPAAIDLLVVHIVGLSLSEFRGEKESHLFLDETRGSDKADKFFPRSWR